MSNMISVASIFSEAFDTAIDDDTFENIDVATVCGQHCATIIGAANTLVRLCDPLVRDDLLEAVNHALEIALHG